MTHTERIEKLESLIKAIENDCTLIGEAVLFLLRDALAKAKQDRDDYWHKLEQNRKG